MPMRQIAGLALFAIGAVLLLFAYRAYNSPLEQISDTLTGRYSDQTMWYMIAGVACAAVGGAILLLGRR